MSDPLLSVRDLHVRFRSAERGGLVRAVDGVSFDVNPGETVCLVGESGSGKTVTCESVTGLVDAEETTGEIRFDDRNLVGLSESDLRSVRGNRIAHVFQNPQNALDPVYTVGAQLVETIRFGKDCSKDVARERAIELLDRVGIPEAATRFDDYPHEFSGGMRQRVVVAMALSGDPDLLIADEPTTALDVTIQAGILELLRELQAERDMAVLFVTHDLGVVAQLADRVVVMYGGKVMERGDVHGVFDDPAHRYTQALLDCLPGSGGGLDPVPGSPVDPADPPEGCRFHPRCSAAVSACKSGDHPPLYDLADSDIADSDIADSDLGESNRDGCASCVFYGPERETTDLELSPTTSAEATDD
ncbi:ABC transporter ATP-binding protein [Halorussus halophilus]|uniref:ABC transporter ATP-binding protein n=1 Tax=Halorussus halophilus TaxID=2650975 RepID=UPI001300F8D1|nr:ABC transporter ATP-binding protein [Halorussus halophilus]